MFIDKARIFIKAGNGGDGCTSFYTEKYINNGGPDGGDGGDGGDVVFAVSTRLTSLIEFKYSVHFRAQDGERGSGKFCHGKRGKNTVILVPRGTIIRDYETGAIIADMFNETDEVTVLHGGRGGKGNARFKTSRRQAPRFSQTGQKTEEQSVILELKTIADVGLVGYPNVGKSSLLSVISKARPKIANYHFTTLSPNLGVVSYYDNSFVVADIPGLIDGASSGAGLGHEFLRHVERVRLIIHVIDVSGSEGRNPIDDFNNINRELSEFSAVLGGVEQIVALNKADLLLNDEPIKEFKAKIKAPVCVISAVTNDGIEKLIKTTWNKLAKLPPVTPMQFEPYVYKRKDTTEFFIERDDDGAFNVFGGMIDELARNVVLDSYDSFSYFQKRLRDDGVIKELKKAGAGEGDTVRILDIEFEFVE